MPVVPPPNVRSVVILKSDRVYAEVLRQYALRAFPRTQVRLTDSADEAAAALAGEQPDIFVTGVGAGIKGDVLELIARSGADRSRAPRVLVVTNRCEYRVLATLRSLSTEGVFDCAGEEPDRLTDALRTVGGGGRYWSATLMDHLERKGAAANALFRVLTALEQVVLSTIGDGSDDVVAAGELGLSAFTIATVRRELHRKLGVQHRGELVRLAVQLGFVRFTPSGVVRPGYGLLLAAYHARKTKRATALDDMPEAALTSLPQTTDPHERLLKAVA